MIVIVAVIITVTLIKMTIIKAYDKTCFKAFMFLMLVHVWSFERIRMHDNTFLPFYSFYPFVWVSMAF